jgi:hypothetical protein
MRGFSFPGIPRAPKSLLALEGMAPRGDHLPLTCSCATITLQILLLVTVFSPCSPLHLKESLLVARRRGVSVTRKEG